MAWRPPPWSAGPRQSPTDSKLCWPRCPSLPLNKLLTTPSILWLAHPSATEAFQGEFHDLAHGEQVARLHTLLRPHLLRRMKADVLRQLPPKKEQIVAVELSPAQKQARAYACISCAAGGHVQGAIVLMPGLAAAQTCRGDLPHHMLLQVYRGILANSYDSLTRGGVSNLKNVMMELRKAVSQQHSACQHGAREACCACYNHTLRGLSELSACLVVPASCLQVQHTYTQFHPPSPRPPLQQWLQLLLDGSGKLALMDRMLQASKPASQQASKPASQQ